LESSVAQIVKTQSSSTERNRLARSILGAIRELISQKEPDTSTYDMAAYIAMALGRIHQLMEESTLAWEKRGYWLKADRFRLEWEWTHGCQEEIETALSKQDWGGLARILARVAGKFSKVKFSTGSRIGKPWVGALQYYRSKKSR
jgi:hypothetical protein